MLEQTSNVRIVFKDEDGRIHWLRHLNVSSLQAFARLRV